MRTIWNKLNLLEQICIVLIGSLTTVMAVYFLFKIGPKVAIAFLLIGFLHCLLIIAISFLNRLKNKLLRKWNLALEDDSNK